MSKHGRKYLDAAKLVEPERRYEIGEAAELRGYVVPAEITVFEDRSFTFVTKAPLAAALLKRAAGVESGSAIPNKDMVGRVTRAQLREIAEMKMPDLNANTVEQAMKIIEGTARSMGIEVAQS